MRPSVMSTPNYYLIYFMTTANRLSSAPSRFILAVGLASSGLLALALPTFAHAATYAYVNTAMEIRTVVANDWQTALATAPGIHLHSGVVLLTSLLNPMVGTHI